MTDNRGPSLVDLLEREPADIEHEWLFGVVPEEHEQHGFGEAAVLASKMMRNHAPQVSNTGGMNSQVPSEKGDDALLPPREYLVPPVRKNFVEVHQAHWTETDPKLFESLPQGGGGIDWLKVNAYGKLNEKGIALVESLKHAKALMAKKDGVAAGCAEAGLVLQSHKYREHMILDHPWLKDRPMQLGFGTAGVGRSYQPLILRIDGICITFGRIKDSNGPSGQRGPICTVEITGKTFLRLGETGAFNLAQEVVASLGIVIEGMRAQRIDACCDLPGMAPGDFVKHYFNKNKTTKAKEKAGLVVNQDGQIETFSLSSKSTMLRIYDKAAECRDKDDTGERMALMEQNRWGSPQTVATRVEWQFRLGKNRAKKYATFRELLLGLSDLLGWACNTWFCLTKVGKDRTHTSRYKGVDGITDEWLRVLHAFAFWTGRLDHRPIPPRVQSRPPEHLMRTAVGFFGAAMGRVGLVPVDGLTAWRILANWLGPAQLAEKCRERALEYMAAQGVKAEVVEAMASSRSTEDERQFQSVEWILEQRAQLQRREGGEQYPQHEWAKCD